MISCITPSVRPELLEIVDKCLKRQTHKDFEWIVDSSSVKNEGDFYGLNKALNNLFRKSKGDLIVMITDGIWFEPDLLERLWAHYQANPVSCISCVGNQYDQVLNGKPEHMVWQDPRKRMDQGSFYEVEPTEMELCIGSFPRRAVYDVGGIDEEYDKGAALSEKEMFIRIQRMGYKLYIDQSLEYRAIKHDRLSKDWDEKYKIAVELYTKHIKEIISGDRLYLDYLRNSDTT